MDPTSLVMPLFKLLTESPSNALALLIFGMMAWFLWFFDKRLAQAHDKYNAQLNAISERYFRQMDQQERRHHESLSKLSAEIRILHEKVGALR